jgi:hypothetical protein
VTCDIQCRIHETCKNIIFYFTAFYKFLSKKKEWSELPLALKGSSAYTLFSMAQPRIPAQEILFQSDDVRKKQNTGTCSNPIPTLPPPQNPIKKKEEYDLALVPGTLLPKISIWAPPASSHMNIKKTKLLMKF